MQRFGGKLGGFVLLTRLRRALENQGLLRVKDSSYQGNQNQNVWFRKNYNSRLLWEGVSRRGLWARRICLPTYPYPGYLAIDCSLKSFPGHTSSTHSARP